MEKRWGNGKIKPSRPPKGNESNILTHRRKGQASNTKKCRGKKPQNKPSPYPESKIDFQGQCTDLEGYMFDLKPRASENFDQTMKELEQYLRAIYSDR